MKVVLDANVAVSGLLTHHGACAEVLDRMRIGQIQLCIDGRIIAEYTEVLNRPELSIPTGATSDLLDFVRHRAERVDPPLSAAVLPHESDRPFLEVAIEANAILVTGNKRHFPKRACRGGRVLSPREFLDLLHDAQ